MSINTILTVLLLVSIAYFLGRGIIKFITITLPKLKAKIHERNNKK